MYVYVSGSYKPRRDIPIAVRKLKTFSPSRIRDWIREHRTKKDKVTGKRVQVNVTRQSISMWFKRNSEEYEKLKSEIVEEELPKEAIPETIFQNGFFQEIPCIKTWIRELIGRNAKSETIQSMTGDIRRICKGLVRKKGTRRQYEVIEGWGLKHPSRLTLEDGLAYIEALKNRGHATRQYRLSLRNFFESRGIKGRHKISGAIEQMGKYAHIYAPKVRLYEVFEYLKALNYEAYLASFFSFKTACRITATLTANSKKMNHEERTILVLEKATKGKGKRPQKKLIPDDLWELIKDRKGILFNITPEELNGLLRSAYKEVLPELADEIPMPFHFWRHQFAQHFLRASGWNYALCARLGHWTVSTLERYYGKMGEQTAFEAGRQFLPNI